MRISENQKCTFCRTHLGAKSSGTRSKIVYEITKSPENGTLYWVAEGKEAKTFTQLDIDEERVLYAQLNMKAFQVGTLNCNENTELYHSPCLIRDLVLCSLTTFAI